MMQKMSIIRTHNYIIIVIIFQFIIFYRYVKVIILSTLLRLSNL